MFVQRMIVVMFAAFIFQTRPSLADPRCPDRPIRLAFYEHGRLFDAERDEGIDKDIVTQLILNTDCQFETFVAARARIWVDLEQGNLDMTTSGIQTPERDRFAAFAPYIKMKNHFILPKNNSHYASLADLQNNSKLKYLVVRSFRHEPPIDAFLQTIEPKNRIIEVPTAELTLQILSAGRADVTVSQPVIFFHFEEKYQLKDRFVIKDLIPDTPSIPLGLVLSRKTFSDEQLVRWQNLITSLIKSGKVGLILAKHLPQEWVGPASYKD